MSEIRTIYNYFNRVISNNRQNARDALRRFVSNAEERYNPWFAKAAKRLSVFSKINVQKSFWRFK